MKPQMAKTQKFFIFIFVALLTAKLWILTNSSPQKMDGANLANYDAPLTITSHLELEQKNLSQDEIDFFLDSSFKNLSKYEFKFGNSQGKIYLGTTYSLDIFVNITKFPKDGGSKVREVNTLPLTNEHQIRTVVFENGQNLYFFGRNEKDEFIFEVTPKTLLQKNGEIEFFILEAPNITPDLVELLQSNE
jgi:hypothetical protein